MALHASAVKEIIILFYLHMKKIFIISGVLLVVVLIFLGIYNFAFRDKAPVITNDPRVPADTISDDNSILPPPDAGDMDVAGEDKIIPVTMAKALSPIIDKDKGELKFYDKATGQLLATKVSGGTEQTLSDVGLPDLVHAAWASDTQRVLTKFVSDGQTRVYFYDHRTGQGTLLKEGVRRVDWTILGDQILYTYYDAGTKKYSLNVAQPDGTAWRTLVDNVTPQEYFADVPRSSRIALWPAPAPYTKTRLRVVSVVDRNATPTTLFESHYNADFLFSPDGNLILISSTPDRGSNKRGLGLMNANGGEYRNLQIPTNVAKAVWSSDSQYVYYALPTGTQDTFWRLDTHTNKKNRLIALDNINASQTQYNAFNLILTSENDALFFVNQIDGRLYRIEL